jgi:prolyl-tRNA editing enzyme YbaK/EbsC (Cys-tRNA(Pro) deacylase)
MRDTVIASARRLGLEVDVRRLEQSTATVGDAAKAVGCEPAEIAKSLVFVADGDPVLCIASGSHRVDLDLLAGVLDVAEVRQASPDEVRAADRVAGRGVPPFGHDLPAVLDETLLAHDRVFAAGGDGHSLFAVDPRKLVECTGASVAAVAES